MSEQTESLEFGRRWFDHLFPAPPEAVQTEALHVQIDRLKRQVPNLYSVAMFNIAIILILLWNDKASWAVMAVPIMLMLFCAVRIISWLRQDITRVADEDATKILRRVTIAGVSGSILASLWCVWSLASGVFGYPLLGPISLALGVICVAHCLATVRVPAILALVFGIYPSGIAMALSGDPLSTILGLTFMTAGILQVRLINEQYELMIKGLLLEKQIRDQANSDALTGLPNRRAFIAEFESKISQGAAFGVALIDLDGFKQVNDRLGHLAGDLLLQIIAERLTATLVRGDIAGRFGGDEFVMLLHGDAIAVSAKATGVLGALCQYADVEGERISIAASLGYAIHACDGDTSVKLLAAADVALYAAKQAGKAQVKAYEQPEVARLVA